MWGVYIERFKALPVETSAASWLQPSQSPRHYPYLWVIINRQDCDATCPPKLTSTLLHTYSWCFGYAGIFPKCSHELYVRAYAVAHSVKELSDNLIVL